jgi:hypothetical protein
MHVCALLRRETSCCNLLKLRYLGGWFQSVSESVAWARRGGDGVLRPRTKYGICFQIVTNVCNKKHRIETLSHSDTKSHRERIIGIGSGLGFRRGQIASLDRVREASAGVRAVAKWFVGRLAASTKADGCSACEAKGLSYGIDDFEVSFDANRAIIVDRDFGRGHCSAPQGA